MTENFKKDGFKNHRQILTDEMIDKIANGTAPWQKPWPKGLKKERPFSVITKKEYRGGNLLALSVAPYGDPRWLTFRQAANKRWKVKQGEKGYYVEYINWLDLKKETDPETGEEKTVYVRREHPIISRAVVFNGEQISGIPAYTNELTKNLPVKQVVETAQGLIENSGAEIIFDAPGEAWYDMENDKIHISPKESFNSTYDMYSAILHELAHWTAHPSRLDRSRASAVEDPSEYAREELRAEIASYFMAFELGVGATQEHIDNHAAFAKEWLNMLGKNRNEIYRVAKDAETICSYIYSNFLLLDNTAEIAAQAPAETVPADHGGIRAAEEKPARKEDRDIFDLGSFDPFGDMALQEPVTAGAPSGDCGIPDSAFLDF